MDKLALTIVYLIFIGAILLNFYVLYIFYNFTLVIWWPDKAKEPWIEIVNSPAVQLFHPLIKWMSPLYVIFILLAVISELSYLFFAN